MLAQPSSSFRTAGCPDGLTDRDRQAIEDRLHRVAFEGPSAIEQRLQELDREWSAGRVAKVIAAAGILFGLAAAVLVSWWALIVPVAFAYLWLGAGAPSSNTVDARFDNLVVTRR